MHRQQHAAARRGSHLLRWSPHRRTFQARSVPLRTLSACTRCPNRMPASAFLHVFQNGSVNAVVKVRML